MESLDQEFAAKPVPNGLHALAPVPLPVHFGARDDDVMPHSWAERALTWLHENKPEVFGDMMLATMNVPAHTAKTRGK